MKNLNVIEIDEIEALDMEYSQDLFEAIKNAGIEWEACNPTAEWPVCLVREIPLTTEDIGQRRLVTGADSYYEVEEDDIDEDSTYLQIIGFKTEAEAVAFLQR